MSWSIDGLPIGLQFVARDCDEATLLCLAAQTDGVYLTWIMARDHDS